MAPYLQLFTKRTYIRPRPLHLVMSEHVCWPHIPAVCWRVRPHAPHGPVPCSLRLRGGSCAVVSRCSPLLSTLFSRLYTSQVHHTSPVTSLTSNMLARCDSWWQPRTMTRYYMHVSDTTVIVLFASLSVITRSCTSARQLDSCVKFSKC